MSAVTRSEIPRTASDRSPAAARRFGYLLGIAFNVVLLYLINIAPGWQAVPWLTAEAGELVGLANACLIVSIAINALDVLADPTWLRALGDAVSCVLTAILAGRLLQVYPFDFTGWGTDWSPLVTIVLVLVLIGTAIGAIASVVRFFVALARSGR